MTRSVRLGAVLWLVGVAVFFAAQVVVQTAWTVPFSWADNNISDLGNVHCGQWNGVAVCSPWHALMNASFIVTGVLLAAGLVLTARAWGGGAASVAARVCLFLAVVSYPVAGLFPADVDENPHVLAAFVIFFVGNAGLLVAGAVRRLGRLRWTAVALGLLAVAGTWMHLSGHDGGLGRGGAERVAAYAFPLWLVVAGVSWLRPLSARARRLTTSG